MAYFKIYKHISSYFKNSSYKFYSIINVNKQFL